MKRLFAALLILAPNGFASTNPFECVDPDVVDAFMGHYWHQDPSTFSTAAPPDFVSLRLPEDFVLIGSQSSESHRSVVYKTDRDATTALSTSINSVKEDGWALIEQRSRMGFGGFEPQSRPVTQLVCRDSTPGVMSITSVDRSGRTLVSFAIHTQQASQTCADMNRERSNLLHRMPLEDYMPRLTLPSDVKTKDWGMGGSGDEMSSRVVLGTSRTRDELIGLLGEQIRNQDWRYDSGWSGSVSSGSVWLLSGGEDGEMLGVLRITEASSGVFNSRFSVSPVTVDKSTFSGGTFSSSSH